MKYRRIRNCGKLGIEFRNADGEGARIARDLIANLLENIVRRSTEYYDKSQKEDHAFSYRERQFHSVVCPSVAEITCNREGFYLMERPLKRKPAGEDEYTGNADYWISYRSYSFLIELKHCYFGFRNVGGPHQNIMRKFDSAMRQLGNVRIDECRNLVWKNRGLIKIAMLAIVFYKGSRNLNFRGNLEGKDCRKLFKTLLETTDLEDKTNVTGIWLLHERLTKPIGYDNRYEVYPAVAFVGNISESSS